MVLTTLLPPLKFQERYNVNRKKEFHIVAFGMLPRALRMYSRDKREEALVQIIRRWGTVDPQMKEEVGFAIFLKT